MNPTTLLAFLLNISGLATFMLNPILGSDPSTATTSLPTVIIVYKATIYSYYILICFKSWLNLCWLMLVYIGRESIGDKESSSSVGSDEV